MNLTNRFIILFAALALTCLISVESTSQDLRGAWKLLSVDGKPADENVIKIYSDNYFMFGAYTKDGKFVRAGGGKYVVKGKEYTETADFNTAETSVIRKPVTQTFTQKSKQLTLTGNGKKETWEKVDDGNSKLAGAWRFGARVNDNGEAGERRPSDSPRQTMKILSGKYFQWAAFNFETKEFSGTGGGTYVLQDDKYTETIGFFSRDDSKAGISLTFDCRVDGTDWYHKGKGTTGNPVSEVWVKNNE